MVALAAVSADGPYFNPRPPRGGRPFPGKVLHRPADISIHAPLAGGDGGSSAIRNMRSYFNPRPPRGGRRIPCFRSPGGQFISIHAPLAGGDTVPISSNVLQAISIHAPLAGGDAGTPLQLPRTCISIHAPLAGGDPTIPTFARGTANFNPRPPRGGRHCLFEIIRREPKISIHAPLAGGDADGCNPSFPTHISIHAPLAGGDRRSPLPPSG